MDILMYIHTYIHVCMYVHVSRLKGLRLVELG